MKRIFNIKNKVFVALLFIFIALTSSCSGENAIVKSRDGLVLRDGIGLKASKITVIPYGSVVSILRYSENEENIGGISARWARVKYNKYEGWVFGGYLQKKEFILNSEGITHIEKVGLVCYGRSWFYNEELKPQFRGNILFINLIGHSIIYTVPDEYNETPIVITGKKNIVFQFDKELDKKITFKISALIRNKKRNFDYQTNGYKKTEVKIPLPKDGTIIDRLQIDFIGDKCILGVKAIYLEL